MALVFLFALASIALMTKVVFSGLTFTTGFAIACFIALAAGVFLGAMIQAKHREDER